MKINIIPTYLLRQCVAKTSNNTRCRRKPIDDHFLCGQHNRIYKEFLEESLKSKIIRNYDNSYVDLNDNLQIGGQLWGFNILNFLIPSCLDILSCDWITDITYAIPGLASLIQLMSY